MTQTAYRFYLKIQQVEKVCLFELAWGRGQQLSITIPYPENLTIFYQDWQTKYLSFYHRALRGRVVSTGTIIRQVDWEQKLVQAEAKLLCEFHRWLRHEELFEIRAIIAQAAKQKTENFLPSQHNTHVPTIDIFLTCNCQELCRLPWEVWEITEFAASSKIRIVRQPINIHDTPVNYQSKPCRGKARVLAILGDDTGLNFQVDREAVKSLSPIAEVEFVGWQPHERQAQLKDKIVKAIKDERGWDILFFAGHSNENLNTGGELAIAPGISLSMIEIAQSLTIAKQRGLQFAIFNSCSGLSIANTLIDLGLSQVAVMREPIHNQVAQEFLVRFLQSLAEYKDVHESLLSACQFLKLEKNLTYPSTYLIPSLFCHPDAPLFCLQPSRIKDKCKRWLPSKQEAMALGSLILCSWQLSTQSFLIEKRVLVQAMYRQFTNQPDSKNSPPVLLVEIDEESIKKAKISDPRPMDRSYIAKIIDRLTSINAKIIGVDYLLDRHQPKNDRQLARTLRSSIKKQNTWFVLATSRNLAGSWFEPLPELASPNWQLQGDTFVVGYDSYVTHFTLLPRQYSSKRPLPFAYWLAVAHRLNFEQSGELLQPQINSSESWVSQVKNHINQTTGEYGFLDLFSNSSRLQPLTKFSYKLGQMWMHPIIDFSVPPEAVFQRLPAWQLLESNDSPLLPLITLDKRPSIVIIAARYKDAGLVAPGGDNFPLPAAVGFWRSQHPANPSTVFTGGEIHAYMVHHLLNQRLVIPIPNLWLIVLAALLGKGTVLVLGNSTNTQKQEIILLLFLLTLIYALASLQIYISAAILLPWLLPSLTFWIYIFLYLINRKSRYFN
ncbi:MULTISPECIES: CHASE2 domain-containing protein [unclassified Okeania]|uniref:CHASE2 domain-containing protein n=1 Tax=unclassified Okeania TaxID=2634635 RepID=UPI0013BDB113|nr:MULTISPECIES: CHASE2 domain-containing protein [unclassified Okeania]NES78101.1 CHASE2 domain-containing protein [Okeania sp. SIO1H4]NET18840.1 CHASE2 domain-containing protein [Okeania sp. SIO1H5]NET94834.1 CHASE2 domain-containing protein [Okeania sp. SIO1H2]